MDTFHFDNVKIEKANAMLRYHRLQNLTKLFRFLELCLALVFLSWTSAHLPLAIQISAHYFRQLISIIVSPLFIFILTNAIVLTLLAKSGQSTTVNNVEANFYEKFVEKNENHINMRLDNSPPVPEPDEIVHDDKQIIYEIKTITTTSNCEGSEVTLVTDTEVRRLETKNWGKVVSSGETAAETVDWVEDLSNDEFKRTIEAFIARQIRFHQEEKLAIVLPS